jgi:DHA2 family multidrug resistance protein
MVNGASRILVAGGSSLADAHAQATGMAYSLLQRHATMLAFVDDFWMMGLTFLGLIPLMIMMKKSRADGSSVSAH